MGKFINPGNAGFQIVRNDHYVDKSGIIGLINETIDKPRRFTCICRPRRFGKSFAADMLCAYYDVSCDSHTLFDDLEIAQEDSYEAHLNQYNVIYLDITSFLSDAKQNNIRIEDVVRKIIHDLKEELEQLQPDLASKDGLTDQMLGFVEATGRKFVFVIDEWDALIREASGKSDVQSAYLNFLRGLFKNGNFTRKAVAAAYMTGILPIKKDGSQSAISDFREYSILTPGRFAKYTGFTEEEVRKLCMEYDMDFKKAKEWYDGYSLGNLTSVYNPYSVMMAMENQRYQSYWQQTSAAEALLTYIDMDEDGLQDEIARLISGEWIAIKTSGFQNDFETFHSKDDVLTLLVHLGYLAYECDDQGVETVWIPNEEVRIEFHNILRKGKHQEFLKLVKASDQLLEDTLQGNGEAVAAAMEKLRASHYAPTFYNDEQTLRSMIRMAYITCVDQYLKIEELPSGKGLADVVFIPTKKSWMPAMVIELKWNKSEQGAIAQIKDRNYPAVLRGVSGTILLVGINYDEKTKKHSCMIERMNLS